MSNQSKKSQALQGAPTADPLTQRVKVLACAGHGFSSGLILTTTTSGIQGATTMNYLELKSCVGKSRPCTDPSSCGEYCVRKAH